ETGATYHLSEVLLTVEFVADATGGNTGLGREGPQELTGFGIKGDQFARAAVAGEHEATGGRDGAHGGALRLVGPDFLATHRIPGDELRPAAARNGALRIVIGRIAANEAHLQVEGAHALTGGIGVGDAAFARGEVEPAGVETVGHRMPAVCAGRAGLGDARPFVACVLRRRIDIGTTGFHVVAGSPVHRHEVLGHQQFTRGGVHHVVVTTLGGLHRDVAHSAVDLDVGNGDLLHGVEVPFLGGDLLVVPAVFTGVGVERDDGNGEQVVAALRAACRRVPGCTVADTEEHEVGLGVVGHRIPGGSAAPQFPPVAGPGLGGHAHGVVLEAVGRIAGHRVEAPHELAGFGVIGGDITTVDVFGAGVADEHLAVGDARSAGDGVVATLVRGDGAPHFLAGGGVERNQAAVVGTDVDLAVPGSHTAVDHVATAARAEFSGHLRV